MKFTMEEIVNYAKTYGFVYQGSHIYGGLANTWDYGPLGVELKKNIKDSWWSKFVRENKLNVGLDGSILMNTKVWEASGHLAGFSDPLTTCQGCNSRYRVDKLIGNIYPDKDVDGWTNEEYMTFIKEHNIDCPKCGENRYSDIKHFNLMFRTEQGVVTDSASIIYLRPETAQGIFVNFKNIQRTTRRKVPFGVGQIGKSFRNEITPGNFIFRTREFEQMELEFFCVPGSEDEWFNTWVNICMSYLESIGLSKDDIKLHKHPVEKLSHYSKGTTDILFKFPWGFDELWGIASRTNFDLLEHQKHSGESMTYIEPDGASRYIPHVIEPSVGVERLFLAILSSALDEETLDDGSTRLVLRLHPKVAPVKVAILPLIKKYHSEKALEIEAELSKYFNVQYDDAGKIGKRYRRQDAIGTPFVITVDDNSINDDMYTLRYRDTMKQVTGKLNKLIDKIQNSIKGDD